MLFPKIIHEFTFVETYKQ